MPMHLPSRDEERFFVFPALMNTITQETISPDVVEQATKRVMQIAYGPVSYLMEDARRSLHCPRGLAQTIMRLDEDVITRVEQDIAYMSVHMTSQQYAQHLLDCLSREV